MKLDFIIKAINHHNQHYWSEINPNWALENNVQTRWSINVWCGLIDEHLVGPYFNEGNLIKKKYLHFLKNKLPTSFIRRLASF